MERLDDVGRLASQVSQADLARLLALLGNEDVLDLGSGTGFYTDRIAQLTTGTVYALELLPEMSEHYRERGPLHNVRLVQGDMTALDAALTPGCVDVAITTATWHEIGGRLDVSGLATMLRPDGRLIVIDWAKDPDSWDFGPPKDVRYSAVEVTATLASHFDVVSVQTVGPSMFALTAKRR
jgi:protein-L-isoaspartate O-methyltransferase